MIKRNGKVALYMPEIYLDPLLTLEPNGGEWSGTHPSPFTLEERAPATHYYEAGWIPQIVCMFWRRYRSLASARI
jgi:hypothetical protein